MLKNKHFVFCSISLVWEEIFEIWLQIWIPFFQTSKIGKKIGLFVAIIGLIQKKIHSFWTRDFWTPCTFWALSQKLLQIKTWGWVWMIQNWFSHVPWVFWQCLKLILGHLGAFWLSNERYLAKHKMFIFQQFLGFCKNSVFFCV